MIIPFNSKGGFHVILTEELDKTLILNLCTAPGSVIIKNKIGYINFHILPDSSVLLKK